MRGQIDHTEFYKELGQNIRRIREVHNLLQKDIAKAIGITFQQYQKYESGANRIPAKSLAIFCDITGTDIKELLGCSVDNYDKNLKEGVVNYNTNHHVTNVYHYNGFFSNLLNMDLSLMKNKIALFSIVISLLIYLSLSVLKFFPAINSQYNSIFMQVQILGFMVAFAITMFVVFGYSILSYLFGYVAFYALVFLLYRLIYWDLGYLNDMILKASLHLIAIILTVVTFYVLKKCKVNLNLQVSKKEA